MLKLKETAEMLHALGANVLPIRNGKIPAIMWDNLQTERQSTEELTSYDWNNCTGLGLVCGVNGYTCIDVDAMKDATVVAALLKLLGLPDQYPWQVRSGSGKGHHIWIKVSGRLPFKKGVAWGNSKDGSFDHLEIRWKDCQTLVPPSQHESGKHYEWVHGQPTTEPAVVDPGVVVSAFEAVAYLKVEDPNKERPTFKRTEYVELLQNGVEEGRRNDSCAAFAGHLRKTGMEYSECLEWLKLWNRRLSTPLDEAEVEKTVSSIYSYPSSDIILHDGIEMCCMETLTMNEIVEGIIGEQSLNFLAGEEGAGKSLLAMNLALSVATGLPKFLEYSIKKHGKVLFLNNELPFSVFLHRFKQMRTAMFHEQSSKLNNFVTPEFLKPIKESWDDLCKVIVQEQPILVVLDCLYWAHDRKENDSSEMKDIMRMFVELRDRFGIAVLIVHHTKKGTRYEGMHNDNMRGSMVFSASSDTVMLMRRSPLDESKRVFKPTKLRNGSDEMRKARLLALNPGDLWFSDEGEANEEEHIAVQGGTSRPSAEDKINFVEIFGSDTKLKRKDIVARCENLGFSERTVDRCLKSANKQNGELSSPEFGWYELKPADTLPDRQAA